jgi:hypothetical protein
MLDDRGDRRRLRLTLEPGELLGDEPVPGTPVVLRRGSRPRSSPPPRPPPSRASGCVRRCGRRGSARWSGREQRGTARSGHAGCGCPRRTAPRHHAGRRRCAPRAARRCASPGDRRAPRPRGAARRWVSHRLGSVELPLDLTVAQQRIGADDEEDLRHRRDPPLRLDRHGRHRPGPVPWLRGAG